MTCYARNFPLSFLTKCSSATNVIVKKNSFPIGINVESAPAAVFVRGPPDQSDLLAAWIVS